MFSLRLGTHEESLFVYKDVWLTMLFRTLFKSKTTLNYQTHT